MFKIVQFPEKIKPFFAPLVNQFHFNHFQHFQTLVLLIAFAWGRCTIANLYRWRELNMQIGHRVAVWYSGRRFVGNCIGIDPEKGLLL